MFSFFKNLFKKPAPNPRPTLPNPGTQPQPAPQKPAPGKTPAPVEKPGATAKAREEWARQAAQKINPDATPEQLCGIEEGMTKEQISAQLAVLYRRHNRAASSLESGLREEAEIMLDVIAMLRQKYGG